MRAVVTKILPFKTLKYERVKTYVLELANGKTKNWYDNGKRPLNVEVGDVIDGLKIYFGQIDYKASQIEIVLTQLNMFNDGQ